MSLLLFGNGFCGKLITDMNQLMMKMVLKKREKLGFNNNEKDDDDGEEEGENVEDSKPMGMTK